MKKVAVIIVSYNGLKYLPNLLGSIFNHQSKVVALEVMVVDNHSTDNSVEWLKKNYPPVNVIEQQENLGFAQGSNIGFELALARNFDYVLLLNQDITVTAGYLDKLLMALESDERVAAVQPKIMLYPETHLINSLGNVIHYLGFGYTYGHRQKNIAPRLPNDLINYCSGAVCLIKTAVLKEIGFFDKDFFMYHEDLDLGWRFSLAGYKNLIVPSAVVHHQYEFSRSIKKYYYMERNRWLVIFQNYKIRTIILILPALLIMELGLFFLSIVKGWWREKIKVYAYFINCQHLKKIIERRKLVQQQRQVGDREVIWNFSGKIEHQEIDSFLVKAINPFFNLYWQLVKRLIFW